MPSKLAVPVQAGTYRITSAYRTPQRPDHRGIDIAHRTPGVSYLGFPILAAATGQVIVNRASGTPTSGFGWVLVLRHVLDGQIVDTVYGHVYSKDVLVKQGQWVGRGEQIARVGANGGVAPHLHFEVCPEGWYTTWGTWVDPEPWFVEPAAPPIAPPVPKLAGDFNGDGKVDLEDLKILRDRHRADDLALGKIVDNWTG